MLSRFDVAVWFRDVSPTEPNCSCGAFLLRRLVTWLNETWNQRVTSDRERALAELVEAQKDQIESLQEQIASISSERDVALLENELLMQVQARNLERVKAEVSVLNKSFATLEDANAE